MPISYSEGLKKPQLKTGNFSQYPCYAIGVGTSYAQLHIPPLTKIIFIRTLENVMGGEGYLQ